MVVTPLLQKGVDVTLPETVNPGKMPENAKQLTMAIKQDGSVFVNQNWVPKESLKATLAQVHDSTPDKDVMIRQAGGLPEIVAALKAGQIHGGTFGFPAVLHARAAGFRVLVDYNTAGYRYPLSTIIVTQKLLRTQESAIRRFLEAQIEAIHKFKTDPNFAMNVIGKYTQTTDRAMLEETQKVYAAAFERVPYPEIEDMKLGLTQVAETNPRVRDADPKQFVDGRLLREIEASGFVKKLYGER